MPAPDEPRTHTTWPCSTSSVTSRRTLTLPKVFFTCRNFRTLQVHVDNNRNFTATAAALGIHVNTARYRIEKIQTAFGLDLADLDTFTWLVVHCRYPEPRTRQP